MRAMKSLNKRQVPAAPAAGTSEETLWDRLIRPDQKDIAPEVARYFLGLAFGEQDKARMHELAAKARAGTLTGAEQAEIANYERVGSLLGLLQAKARLALKD